MRINNIKREEASNDVLLLNMDFTPLKITSFRRGFKLVYKGKAEIIESEPGNPVCAGAARYDRPTIIRLLRYIPMPYRQLPLSREAILRREGFKCIYCGNKKKLTLDHIIPRSRGGGNTWTNLVAACHDCNVRKGDKKLENFLSQNGLRMDHEPYKPNYIQFLSRNKVMRDEWKKYFERK